MIVDPEEVYVQDEQPTQLNSETVQLNSQTVHLSDILVGKMSGETEVLEEEPDIDASSDEPSGDVLTQDPESTLVQ